MGGGGGGGGKKAIGLQLTDCWHFCFWGMLIVDEVIMHGDLSMEFA